MSIEYSINLSPNKNCKVTSFSKKTGDTVCKCKVNVDKNKWTVAEWFTSSKYKSLGFGKKTLRTCLETLLSQGGYPDKVEYVWNGENEYVLTWMEKNFDAKCTCPRAVQKYASDDDWTSHVYELDVEMFFNYFEIDRSEKVLER